VRRRDFLIGSAIVAAGAGRTWGQSSDLAKLDRIAIMTLCFDSILMNSAHPDDPKRTLSIMDVPEMFADRYGVHSVELSFYHFLSTESAYIEEFRDRLNRAKSRINQISLGQFVGLNMSSTNPVVRLETIDLTKRWIEHAAVLNCPRIMVNQGSLAPEVRQDAFAALKAMVDYGKTKNVSITMENRNSSSGAGAASASGGGAGAASAPAGGLGASAGNATWEVTVEAIKATGAFANPDMNNFPDEEARKAGLRVMYTMTAGSSHCHHNSKWSEADAIAIANEVGYKGLYSIEVTGGPDPYLAVQSLRDELLKDL
jgi:hypothetical protein